MLAFYFPRTAAVKFEPALKLTRRLSGTWIGSPVLGVPAGARFGLFDSEAAKSGETYVFAISQTTL